jgi:hypothetical protein
VNNLKPGSGFSIVEPIFVQPWPMIGPADYLVDHVNRDENAELQIHSNKFMEFA